MKRRDLLRALAAAPLLMSPLAHAIKGARPTIAVFYGGRPDPAAVGRVFAAGAPAAVLVYVLAPDALLGWPSRLDEDTRRLLPRVRADLPHLGRLSGRGSTITIESLLAMRPDLILDVGTVDPTHLSSAERVSQQTGLPYVLVDGSLTDHPAQLREVGGLLGVPTRGEALATAAERIFTLTHTILAREATRPRPRVYYARGPEGMETGLDGSINMEVIAFAGAHNVAAQAGRGGIARVSMEQILAWDPELILTQDVEFSVDVLDDPLWRTVRAVRERRVHLAPSAPFGWLDGPPSVNRLIGVQWLLSILYPGRHPELTPARMREDTVAFCRTFYGSEPPASVLEALARTPLSEAM